MYATVWPPLPGALQKNFQWLKNLAQFRMIDVERTIGWNFLKKQIVIQEPLRWSGHEKQEMANSLN